MRPMLLVLALALPISAAAHDVWMEAPRFVVPVGVAVPYRIFVGHGPDREPWDVKPDRIARVQSIGARGAVTLKPARTEAGSVRFALPGIYIVALESTHAFSDLPGPRFTDYAKEEGLTPALALRERTGTTARNGREMYSRRTKMLVRVGTVRGVPPHVLRPVGQTLEMVVQADPFVGRAGASLPVRVFYQGKPLAGATVKLTNLDADAKPVATIVTGLGGVARFRHPGRGRWQFNTVWTRPIVGNPRAEFDTTFASLTFGS